MNRLDPTRKAGKMLAGASLALGLWFSPVSGASAAERPYRPNCPCPPSYQNSSPYYPQTPGAAPTPARPGETAPMAPMPGDMGTGQQNQDQTQNQAQNQAQDQTQQQQNDFSQSADSSRANPAPGMNTPQLGRLDQANRLNLFDNMVAAPMNKVWFGFQYSSGINTGLQPGAPVAVSFASAVDYYSNGVNGAAVNGSSSESSIFSEQRQTNYRAGAELLLTQDTSIAFQAQYFSNVVDGSVYGDDWSNPQILLKQVLARDCDTIVSATVGLTPQTSVGIGDFNENTTKIYPGMLYYETLSPNLFTQGGFQFGIPFREDQITTFDWSVALGYWLYRDCSLDNCACCCCNSGRITGIIPQVNVLGKHVIGDNTRFNAFGFDSLSTGIIYGEYTDVIDLSVGTLIMIGCDVQVGLGYSFPISDNEVRDSEFLSYVNYLF